MEAVILAAWKWERLMPLTQTKPKPMVKVFGKPILEHVLETIQPFVNKIIIVVKHHKEAIIDNFWKAFKWTPIQYVVQWDEKGTGAALRNVMVEEDLVILNGDTIYSSQDIKNLIAHKGYGILAKEVESPSLYGVFEIDQQGLIKRVIEKPSNPPSKLANIGAYKLPADILKYVHEIPISPRGEYEITDALNILFSMYEIKAIPLWGVFLDIGFPWHILKANTYFFTKYEAGIYGNWDIEDWVQIHPGAVVILSQGSRIKKGSVIAWNLFLWRGANVGPNSFIRDNVVVWNNSMIGFSVELKNVVIGDNTKVPHLSYLGDSIIWDNVNIWWGSIVANLRHDEKNVFYLVKGKLTDTGLRKFGCVIWDGAKLGVNTLIYPGRQIAAGQTTLPWEIVK